MLEFLALIVALVALVVARNAFNQIAVRVKNGDPLAIFDVILYQIEKQRGFSSARCTDDITMTRALLWR